MSLCKITPPCKILCRSLHVWDYHRCTQVNIGGTGVAVIISHTLNFINYVAESIWNKQQAHSHLSYLITISSIQLLVINSNKIGLHSYQQDVCGGCFVWHCKLIEKVVDKRRQNIFDSREIIDV